MNTNNENDDESDSFSDKPFLRRENMFWMITIVVAIVIVLLMVRRLY